MPEDGTPNATGGDRIGAGSRSTTGPAAASPAPLARGAQPLAIAVSALLLAQWPLRDLVGGGSVLANDLAQVLFAIYVVVAVVHASARHAHLVAAPRADGGSRALRVVGALVPLPWCAWMLWAGTPLAWRSLIQLERFPETFSPGYFAVKAAMLLLGLLLAGQCLRDARREWRR